MKVLLTGASGFVGSHILDRLRAGGVPAAVLLRASSNPRFIQAHLRDLDVRQGAISDPASLQRAMAGITHVVHCAGCTKAARTREFYEVNQLGTRNVVDAANREAGIKRIIHVSSLAAAGPAIPARPSREEDPPRPVSEYGRSKLAGEYEVRQRAQGEFVILRPPAVYGPRDGEFFRIFKAVSRHVAPKPGPQPLSLVFVRDLASAVVACLDHPAAARKTFYVAAQEVVTARQMADEIAAQMGTWAFPLPLPTPAFWPLCLLQEAWSRLTGNANVLSLQKYSELRAPGWVCEAAGIQQAIGFQCTTSMKHGINETLAWYRENRWL